MDKKKIIKELGNVGYKVKDDNIQRLQLFLQKIEEEKNGTNTN